MEKYRLGRRLQNNSGIILFIVLWALVILTTLAVSLGRGTNIELTLAKYSIAKLKAKYLAWGGLVYAIHQISLDSEDKDSKDTLTYCAIPVDAQKSPESLFKQRPLGDGYFEVAFLQYDTLGEKSSSRFGLEDEERKINVNALKVDNADVFSSLIVLLGFDEELAKTIAFSVVDWIDTEDTLSQESYGAEEDYYAGLGYHCKNKPFDSPEELLMVKGMTKEIFKKIKNYITIFPKETEERGLKINFDTASGTVLQALARSRHDADTTDADSLVEKVLAYRRGEDGIEATEDDQILPLDRVDEIATLIKSEKDILRNMLQFQTAKSDFLHIVVRGREENLNVDTTIEAVVNREISDDISVVYWEVY